MSFTIATLTCNDRAVLFDVIKEVIENTKTEKSIDWFIYAQGCSDIFIEKIRSMFLNSAFILKLVTCPENQGFSRGTNAVWNNVCHYDYVLCLEDDWRLVKGFNTKWLSTCLSLFQQRPEIDIIFLRKYLTDQEKWQYGWTRNINYHCFQGRLRFNYSEQMKHTVPFDYDGLIFQQIPEFMYTTNPCIYKTSSYKKCNVFPMMEFNDTHNITGEWTDSSKLNDKWGFAEAFSMEKTSGLFTVYLKDGIFFHN